MKPTPSHPKKRTTMFPAEISIIIASRKIRRCLENAPILGSCSIYQVENSRIDQVTSRAMGKKMIWYISNLKVMFSVVRPRLTHSQSDTVFIPSLEPWYIKATSGTKE